MDYRQNKAETLHVKMPVLFLVVCSVASFIPEVNAMVCHTNPLFILFTFSSPFPPKSSNHNLDKILERRAFKQSCFSKG